MSHQALYRKFRPKIFDDVVGQEHVTKTLKNQILTDNIAHAYLFSGIRGTGKTSTAKIFARAVNCLNNHDGNPCNECEICKSILNETNMDVIEMDAASNNSVEDIRELRDKVKFLPVRSKYKVYIIDEVHMLSKGAFNALLKTLEEPPEHLLFILATTEPQKIPATILSRCQRFDLKRISTKDTMENMRKICKETGVDADDKALRLIAANSDGAMRDALSILDRCMSFTQEKIEYETVVNLLGTVNYEVTERVADALLKKDIERTMVLVDDILNQGKELIFFLDELIMYFRNMLMAKTTGNTDSLTDMSDEAAGDFAEKCKNIAVDDLVYYIEELSSTQAECKRVLNPKVYMETKLISMMHAGSRSDVAALMKRIDELEAAVRSGATVQQRPVAKKASAREVPAAPAKVKAVQSEPPETPVTQDNLSDSDIFKIITDRWQDILKAIRGENAGLQAIVRECSLVEVKNKKIVFEFDSKFTFHITAANQPKNKDKCKEVISRFLNTDCEVEFIIKSEKQKEPEIETAMEDIFEDLVNEFGEDKVEFKQED